MSDTDAIQLRMGQAHESLKEAETLKHSALYRGTINRAYYAMFYAVMALAVKKEYVTAKHSGMIAFFDKEFVKTGIFSPELSRALHLGFDRRQSGDYGEMWNVSEEEAGTALSEARLFVEAVEGYLNK
jgi:uncharacterized protein (UPF0332 family)